MLHIWINRLRREWVISNDYIKKNRTRLQISHGENETRTNEFAAKTIKRRDVNMLLPTNKHHPIIGRKRRRKTYQLKWMGNTWKMLLPSKFVMGFSLFLLQKFSRKFVNYPHWYPLLPLSSLFPQVTPMFFCKPRTSHSSSPLPQTTEKNP